MCRETLQLQWFSAIKTFVHSDNYKLEMFSIRKFLTPMLLNLKTPVQDKRVRQSPQNIIYFYVNIKKVS